MSKPVIGCPKCGCGLIRITEYYRQEKVWYAGPHLAGEGLWPDHDVNDLRKPEYYHNLRLECQNRRCGYTWVDEWRKQAHEVRLECPE